MGQEFLVGRERAIAAMRDHADVMAKLWDMDMAYHMILRCMIQAYDRGVADAMGYGVDNDFKV